MLRFGTKETYFAVRSNRRAKAPCTPLRTHCPPWQTAEEHTRLEPAAIQTHAHRRHLDSDLDLGINPSPSPPLRLRPSLQYRSSHLSKNKQKHPQTRPHWSGISLYCSVCFQNCMSLESRALTPHLLSSLPTLCPRLNNCVQITTATLHLVPQIKEESRSRRAWGGQQPPRLLAEELVSFGGGGVCLCPSQFYLRGKHSSVSKPSDSNTPSCDTGNEATLHDTSKEMKTKQRQLLLYNRTAGLAC